MDLTNGQQEARRQIFAWRRAEMSPDFVLHGFAGSGKTTLIRHLTDEARGRLLRLEPAGGGAAR